VGPLRPLNLAANGVAAGAVQASANRATPGRASGGCVATMPGRALMRSSHIFRRRAVGSERAVKTPSLAGMAYGKPWLTCRQSGEGWRWCGFGMMREPEDGAGKRGGETSIRFECAFREDLMR